jgi:hypothetical protein
MGKKQMAYVIFAEVPAIWARSAINVAILIITMDTETAAIRSASTTGAAIHTVTNTATRIPISVGDSAQAAER